jgi:hypothetical protein
MDARCILGFYYHFNWEEKLTVRFYVEPIVALDVRLHFFEKKPPKMACLR